MSEPLRIFIGYDPKEAVAYHVLAHSILRRASRPVALIPLVQAQLRAAGLYTRERGPTESTEFSITRFLTPYLSGYVGTSLYLDSDMVCLADITELATERAVSVVQHDYVPRTVEKMDGQKQTAYPRKNWSSLMVFNNARCRALTAEYVNSASGLDLHRFAWLKDDEIGGLPLEWNHLVGEYPVNPGAKIFHYTLGGPWLPAHSRCDHAEAWFAEFDNLVQPVVVGVGGRPSSWRRGAECGGVTPQRAWPGSASW